MHDQEQTHNRPNRPADAVERPALLLTPAHAPQADAATDVADIFLRGSSELLRTRFTTVKGFAQLLRRHVIDGSSDSARLDRLAQQLEREVAAFEGALLPVLRVQELQWRPDALQFKAVDLNELTRGVVARYGLAPESTARHALRIEPGGPLQGTWDARWLAEALGALLSNALKYTPDGGEIRVSLRREGDQALVSVCDPGIGLPPHEHKRVFLPFVRGDDARQLAPGIGLGLFVADCVARGHGGQVELTSAPARGSVFTLRLPFMPPTHAAA